jgi:transketolase
MVEIRDAFGKALVELGRKNSDVLVLDADLASSTKTSYFAEEFPDRFFQCGVAEQNMMGVAAGLAANGKIPFVASFAVFITKRAADQVSISVAYSGFGVKMVGAYTGLFNGRTGATHMAVEDVSIMRAMPGMVVIDPADAEEMRQVVYAAAEYDGYVYIRETRDSWPDIFDSSYKFKIGKGAIIRDGGDLSLIASGVMTSEAIKAASILAGSGIDARVVNISTIKPIDRELIVRCAEETGALITCENHNIYGGLGSAVAEVLVEECPVVMKRIGIKDTYNECGTNQELLEKYDMDAKYIAGEAERLVKKK